MVKFVDRQASNRKVVNGLTIDAVECRCVLGKYTLCCFPP